MTTVHITTDKKVSIEPFDISIISRYNNAIEVPAHYAGPKVTRRRGMICFCLTDDDIDIIRRIRTNQVEFYIFYNERDDHRDGYEGLESYVSELVVKEYLKIN